MPYSACCHVEGHVGGRGGGDDAARMLHPLQYCNTRLRNALF